MITTGSIDTAAWYSLREAAEVVGMSYDELYEGRKNGTLKVRQKRYTDRLYVHGIDLAEYVNGLFVEV